MDEKYDLNGKEHVENKLLLQKNTLQGKEILQSLTFSWIAPLIKYAQQHGIHESVTYQLGEQDKCLKKSQLCQRTFKNELTMKDELGQNNPEQFEKHQQSVNSQFEGLNLLKTLIITFRMELIRCLIPQFIILLCFAVNPILINFVIKKLDESSTINFSYILICLMLIFLVLIIRSFSSIKMYDAYFRVRFKITNCLFLMIYKRLLNYSFLSNKKYTHADLISLDQCDIDLISLMGFYLTKIVTTLIYLISCIIIFYEFIGKICFLVLFMIILCSLLIYWISGKSSLSNQYLMVKRDERLKYIQQIFSQIRFIKINNLENFIESNIDSKRRQEVQYKTQLKFNNSQCTLIIWAYNAIGLSAVFGSFLFLDQQLTSAKNMQDSIAQYPTIITGIIQLWHSIKRVEAYLKTEGIQQRNIKYINTVQERQKLMKTLKGQQIAVRFINSQLYWKQSQSDQARDYSKCSSFSRKYNNCKFFLKNINLQFQKGKLTMIIGDIGSGKSSLLYAIMNQMNTVKKQSILIDGSVCFSAQKPWIMAGTIKQNILFYSDYNEYHFNKTIYYSCLQQDIKELPNGINTIIGENGINLSGGQKARVSFARALYSDNSIFLLDDILSAVDVHVGQFLIRQTLYGYLRQTNKTVIMPTHAIRYLKYADKVIIMKGGEVISVGSYLQTRKTQIYLDIINKSENRGKQKKQFISRLPFQANKQNKKQLHINLNFEQNNKRIFLKDQSIQFKDNNESIKSAKDNKNLNQNSLEHNIIQSILIEEETQLTPLSFETFKKYLISSGICFVIAGILFYLLWLIFSILNNLIILKWCQSLKNNPTEQQNLSYLLYFIISASGAMLTIFLALIMNSYQSKNLSISIHFEAINSLLSASTNYFFNRFPSGRIINRLSKDVERIDTILMQNQKWLYYYGFLTFGSIIVCIYASSILMIFPLGIIYYFFLQLKNYYVKIVNECTRLISIKNSCILNSLLETLNGVQLIRVFNLKQIYIDNQIKKIQQCLKLKIVKQAVSRVFQQLRILIFTLLFYVPIVLVSLIKFNDRPAITGLVLVYSIDLSDLIQLFIHFLSNFQNSLISIENINHFIKLKTQQDTLKEKYLKNYGQQETTKNIQQSSNQCCYAIEYRNVSLKYFDTHSDIIENICFKIKKGQKVGIIGRTGAGKSTLFNSLLRIIDPHKGQIYINGQKSSNYSLKYLRSQIITLIDQESVILNTSFKGNLDIFDLYSDQQIMRTIQKTGFHKIIEKNGGIHTIICKDSLSVGEKQLLCICRALFKKGEIILIDEATANIDINNTILIENVFKTQFEKKTVLTIAHKISALKNSDLILVLGNKGILQFGSPIQLQSKHQGIYRQMLQKNEKYLLQ